MMVNADDNSDDVADDGDDDGDHERYIIKIRKM